MNNEHTLAILKSLIRTLFNNNLQNDESQAAAAKRIQLKRAILKLVNQNSVEVSTINL